MTKDRTNVRSYGDDASLVAVAPLGTTGPTEANIEAGTLPTGFVELGWLTDAGIDFDRSETVNDFTAHQGGAIVRSKRTAVKESFHIICMEETAITLGLYHSGIVGTVTTASGVTDKVVTKYAVTNQGASDPRAWIVEEVDGAHRKVWVVPNGEVTGRATIPHNNAGPTLYDFTVTIYGDYDLYQIVPV